MNNDTAIAVIGIGCRFPDARGPQEFWRNIGEGKVSFRDLDPERLRAAGLSDEVIDDPAYVKTAATLPGAEDFAAEFFGYSPAEAEATDPQQRLFLEVCWEALESAGHLPTGDPLITGVFAGASASTYMTALTVARARSEGVLAAADDVALHLGGLPDFLSSRVAYKLGLRGPSIGVQTACSSSLTAVHYAVLSLLSGECDLALAGGAAVNEPALGYRHHAGALASRDGYCRPFDSRSTGTSFSSGVGAVVLRRLSDALADGDPVLAVVHGSAVGNDGANRSGFTAPSPQGLADVVAAALDVAGITGEQLRYVEAHGSGTPLGDQIELRGLTEGARSAPGRTGYCGLGSVKANIGHCGPAAGVAGLIKAVHVARTGELPPHPLFERPRSPGVLADSPFRISAEPGHIEEEGRYVLVNSMGLGGTNATVVVGPPPEPTRPSAPDRDTVRLVLSAHSDDELAKLSDGLADELERGAAAVGDIAHTLRVGRRSFARRRVVSAPAGQLAEALRRPAPPTPAALRGVRLVLPQDGEAPEVLMTRLDVAFRGRVEVVTGPAPEAPADRFLILLGRGDADEGRFVLPLDGLDESDAEALTDRLDEALTAAWLHGVDVDWPERTASRGRRVALPAYPFSRKRYWALDRLPPLARPDGPPGNDPATTPPEPATAPDVDAELLLLWRELTGVETLAADDEFGALGGDSLTAMRIEAAVQRRYGVSVNVHRAGGGQATVRRMAEIVRGLTQSSGPAAAPGPERGATAEPSEADLIDADLALPLAPSGTAARARGTDTLLTGGAGPLDAFLLDELLRTAEGRVYRVLDEPDEESGRRRLRRAAEALGLSEPDAGRVPLVLGSPADLGKLCAHHRDGELAARVGRVVHATPRPGGTASYQELRATTVLPLVDLLGWMREHGVEDFTCLSTLAACGSALGGDDTVPEDREQPLDPERAGSAVATWVMERLLERAEADGMRVRVFRTGLLLGATTGACDPDDPLWHLLASGLAVGRHPLDERTYAVSPIDLVARSVAELMDAPGSVGRAYHLVSPAPVTVRELFALLGEAGWPTEGVPLRQWQRAVALRALDRENPVLSPLAPRLLSAAASGRGRPEAKAWQPWLDRVGADPAPTGPLLRAALTSAAARHPGFAELLDPLSRKDHDD
uniref:SDR family oxidoreductase n=1 Tax=Streptomyces sp. NBC_00003 TaxID=2903608 RepID=A0AAU2V0M0_9ACTN